MTTAGQQGGAPPRHIAIIMDGNGRWAREQGKERSYGHHAGAQTLRAIAEEASNLGVKYLTLFTFSTENWNRPSDEVAALMELLLNSLEDESFFENNIRFHVIGDLDKLPERVREKILESMRRTQDNDGMRLVLALSYSSRWEIAMAARKIASEVEAGTLKPDQVDTDSFAWRLSTADMPDPDLLIRTGGELRISNFLLWQCAYSELYFSPTYWPDFGVDEFHKAIQSYQRRERRFGKTSEQVS